MSKNSFKVKNGLTLTPIDPADIINPQAGDLIADSTDDNKIKKYDETSAEWIAVGGSGSGGGIPSLSKGSLITSDGTQNGELAVGADGQILSADSAEPSGLKWIAAPSGGGGGSKYVRGFGIDGFATTGTNKALSILISSSATIQSIKAYARTAPTGASLIFDINKNGVSIFATAGDRLTIAAGSNTSTVGTFSTSLAADDVLELDIDQVGSTVSGQDIVIVIELS